MALPAIATASMLALTLACGCPVRSCYCLIAVRLSVIGKQTAPIVSIQLVRTEFESSPLFSGASVAFLLGLVCQNQGDGSSCRPGEFIFVCQRTGCEPW